MLNGLNGCKFGFSYHILSTNNITSYWYYNQGGKAFALNDMKWLLSRVFVGYGLNERKAHSLSRDICDAIHSP